MRNHHVKIEDFLATVIFVGGLYAIYRSAIFIFNKLKGNL